MTPTGRSTELFRRATAAMPGGVNSPVRAFGAVGGVPRFMVSGSGPYLTDVDGRSYVDLVCSWGPLILGHAHPAVIRATARALEGGTSFGAATVGEIELAEEIIARTPVEKVRLVNSGTEATMSAVRLARGYTGRSKVVKFAGYGGEIACVITEGCPANMGVVPPEPGFNELIAALCAEHGALFVLDEVLTGFRVTPSGWYGREGVAGDLMTFGKVMGGGLPAAAFGGRAEIMDRLAPVGPVYQAGTLSGNPIAVAAGLATLRECTGDVYARVDSAAADLARLAGDALTAAGVPHRVQAAGNLFSVFMGVTGPVRDFADARRQSGPGYAAFFHAMLDAGVYLPPSPFEAWFLSCAHDKEAVARVAAALPGAAKAAAQAIEP